MFRTGISRFYRETTKFRQWKIFHRNIVTSQIPDLELFPGSLIDRVFKDFDKRPDKIAIVDGIKGTQYSYSETLQLVKRVSSGLAKKKVGKGMIVGIMQPNSPEYLFSIYGALSTGATVTFFNQTIKAKELIHLMKVSNVDVIIAHSEVLSTVQEAAKETPRIKDIYVVGDASPGTRSFYNELLEDDGLASPFGQVDIDPINDVAFMPFSSGTTGLPKGVMLTHQNLTTNIAQLHQVKKTLPGENMVLSLPLFHIFSQSITNFGLSFGCKLVTLPKFDPITYLECLSNWKISYLHAVPPQLLFLTNFPGVKDYDLSSIKQVICAAAPLGDTLQQAFYEKMRGVSPDIDLLQAYGMTELSPVSHFLPPREKRPADKKEFTNSVGILFPNMQLKIMSEDGKELGVGQAGEIVLKGPNVMKGYIDNPKATSECLKEGWLYTGDVGKYDEDGYFYIVDRLKELIKYKGSQVAPAELEAVLLAHPAVGHSAVIGKPDDKAGEVPMAFIVKKAEVTEKELQDFVAEHCSDYKHLRGGVVFLDQIPMAPSGKILRRELRNLLKK